MTLKLFPHVGIDFFEGKIGKELKNKNQPPQK